jgi:nucleotide-binding universal stress UspA family protein
MIQSNLPSLDSFKGTLMSGPKILVATDFSPASKAALDLAASVARDRKGSILVVHVKEIVSPFTTDHLYPYQAASEEDLEKQLEEFAPDDSTIPITRDGSARRDAIGRRPVAIHSAGAAIPPRITTVTMPMNVPDSGARNTARR